MVLVSKVWGHHAQWFWFQVPLQSLKLEVSVLPFLSKEFIDIQPIIECGFTLKRVRDMARVYSQVDRTDQYSKQSSIIWPVWLNSWMFVYQLSGWGFGSRCSHLNFRYRACFEKGVPWHSGNYRVWIHYETRTWHDNKIQSDFNIYLVIIV